MPPRKKKATAAAAGVDLAVVETEITPLRAEYEAKLQALAQMTPAQQQALLNELAAELTSVRAARDAIEGKRKAINEGAQATIRAVNALFKPIKDLLDAMDTTIVGYLNAGLQAARGQHNAALQAVGEGARDASTLAVAHATPQTPEGLSEAPEYVLTVVDESAIPRQFLCFDEALALSYVTHKQGKCEIPGVQISIRSTFRRSPGGAK